MTPADVRAVDLPAPAKLNLFLHVTGRRADGYHCLETLFVFLDYGDTVSLTVRDDGVLRRSRGPNTLPPEDDLCLRAARRLKDIANVELGADIGLRKRLPMGGGLGGGSSDAASVLVGLNKLWHCALDEDALARLGLELGADVPVFVRGRAAFATGVGENLAPLALPDRWFVVVCPPVHVATADVFSDSALTRNTKPLKIRGFPWSGDVDAAYERLWSQTHNDCEPVVCAAQPLVRRTRDWLAQRAQARMTGTGACVFAQFRDEAQAQAVAADAAGLAADDGDESAAERSEQGWQVFVARGLSRSPLHASIAMA